MKSTRKLIALLLALTMLAGCGASSGPADMKQEMAMEMPMATEAVMAPGALTGVSDTVTKEVDTSQKLIKRVEMDAETEDLEALLPQLLAEISSLDGYVESQEIFNGSSVASYRYRNARLTIRVPAENLDGLVAQVKGVSNIISYNESVEDVTLAYVDMETRILVLETERDRLLELMEQAETMSDLLEIEARLTDVRSTLESINSQLRVLQNQVSYATIELYINQVKAYTEVEEQTVWQRIGSGFKKNLQNIGEDLVDFFVWAVTYSPQLILWAGILAVVIIVVRRSFQKRKVKKAPRQEDTQD